MMMMMMMMTMGVLLCFHQISKPTTSKPTTFITRAAFRKKFLTT